MFGTKFPFTLEVRGDSVAYDMSCKKVYCSTPPESERPKDFTYLAFEQDGRLYCLEPTEYHTAVYDTPRLLCDFHLEVGDSAWYSHVTKVDTIEVRGVQRKRITLKDARNFAVWVEGIGPLKNGWPTDVPQASDGHICDLIDSCYENGELIFTREDFFAPAVSAGISSLTADETFDGRIYDLSGRIVEQPRANSIYFRNGRKFVQR